MADAAVQEAAAANAVGQPPERKHALVHAAEQDLPAAERGS
jgi:hypothetical protein